jgi:phage terminase small subunit
MILNRQPIRHERWTPRRRLFCQLVAGGMHRPAAAEQAGYKRPQQIGYQLVNVPVVKREIAKLQKRLGVSRPEDW